MSQTYFTDVLHINIPALYSKYLKAKISIIYTHYQRMCIQFLFSERKKNKTKQKTTTTKTDL
jgi:hypothetical protein